MFNITNNKMSKFS